MKTRKILLAAILLLAMLCPVALQAQDTVVASTDLLSSSTLVFTGKCYLRSVGVFTDGTNAATVTVYDNTSAAGKKVAGPYVICGACYFGGETMPPTPCANGIYVVISGTGATARVRYSQ